MDSDILGQIIAIICCVVLSAFFSASETAFTTLNHIRMKTEAMNGSRRARLTLSLAENYDQLLSTILIGNNIVNIVSASLATLVFTYYLQNLGVSVSTVVMTIVVLIFGEISPKSVAKENAEAFAMFAAPILKFLIIILTPLNFLFSLWKKLLSKIFKKKESSKMTQEELKIIVDEAQTDGGIDERNGELILSAIEFNDMDANDILTPRVDVVAVERTASLEEINEAFLTHSFSRLPVYKETIDNIIGMVHEKDFYRVMHQGLSSVESAVKKVVYITGSMKISDLLRLLQQTSTHMAVVVDEFGGTEGIVTMEDILEQLVGDIWDENDTVVQYFERNGENTYLIAGRCNLEELFEEFNLNDKHVEYDSVTVSGWVMEQLGKIPVPGDKFTYEGTQFTVTQTDKRHVLQVEMKLNTDSGAVKGE